LLKKGCSYLVSSPSVYITIVFQNVHGLLSQDLNLRAERKSERKGGGIEPVPAREDADKYVKIYKAEGEEGEKKE
jgi:hypothetical protein